MSIIGTLHRRSKGVPPNGKQKSFTTNIVERISGLFSSLHNPSSLGSGFGPDNNIYG